MIVVEIPGNIKVTSAQNFTAHHYNYLADSLINVNAPTAKLIIIESDSTFYGGTSHTWNYRYESWNGQNPTYYFLHTTQNSLFYDSSISNIILVSVTYVTLPWIDSDSAWVIAEAQDGSNFRLSHPHIKILASLGEALVPNLKPSWYLIYRSLDNANDYVSFILDATDSSKIAGVNLLGTTGLNTFRLQQNYPNPFNPNTVISYSLPSASNVKLIVYNTLGQTVKVLENGFKNAGNYSIQLNGSNLASGIYLYRLESENYSAVKKFILMK
jgi:hypothetical protein